MVPAKYVLGILAVACSIHAQTYAERLGWPKDARVLILHMDDAGMSYESNAGIERVLEQGVAPSLSVMMPCPWVPAMVRYIKQHGSDAGLHLTLTSEWKDYRWPPLSGVTTAPGLVDPEGAMWGGVPAVIQHASADEVDREIHAQFDRAERMGFHPTHLDSHMGTLFASPAFFDKYVKLGIEKKIPVMMPAGHMTYLRADQGTANEALLKQVRAAGDLLWRSGLPVLDDLHNTSYGWRIPADVGDDDAKLQAWRTKMYMETIEQLKPGVTMVIMHCTASDPVFGRISDSARLRKADMLAMIDPKLKAFLKERGFILTTWREMMERRQKVE